jgi:hypothetical protein
MFVADTQIKKADHWSAFQEHHAMGKRLINCREASVAIKFDRKVISKDAENSRQFMNRISQHINNRQKTLR